MEKNTVIKELNAFLKGQYMGIHAYENYIQKVEDDSLKRELQHIQQDHKRHAATVAERIQNLGGRPVDDEGFMGSIQELTARGRVPDTKEGIIEGAIKGEGDYGIKMSEDIVRGDLDQESLDMVAKILDKDREHLDKLRKLLH